MQCYYKYWNRNVRNCIWKYLAIVPYYFLRKTLHETFDWALAHTVKAMRSNLFHEVATRPWSSGNPLLIIWNFCQLLPSWKKSWYSNRSFHILSGKTKNKWSLVVNLWNMIGHSGVEIHHGLSNNKQLERFMCVLTFQADSLHS